MECAGVRAGGVPAERVRSRPLPGCQPAQRLALEFNSDEARLKHLQDDAALRLTGYGYGGRLRTPLKAKPTVSGNWVEYQRGELSEWYVNDSRGLEQGFTLARRAGTSRDGGPLVIALGGGGELRPELAARGDAITSFDDLMVAASLDLRKNGSLLFQRTEHSWHGVRPLQSPRPDIYRKLFIVTVNIPTFQVWWRRVRGKDPDGFRIRAA